MRASVNPRHLQLIEQLRRESIIKSRSVEEAMQLVDRGLFCNRPELYAYTDSPQGIGCAATISAPHMHAYALEWLKDHLTPNSHALDVGSGSGYLTVCMSAMMGFTGKVIGVDHIEKLVNDSISNVNKFDSQILGGPIEMKVCDGRLGYNPMAPYKAIHVGAAAPEIPRALVEQLEVGGRMVIPVGPQGRTQYIQLVDKQMDGSVKSTRVLAVSYIPLTDKNAQV